MPERKPSFIIEDILKCIRHIQTYTSTVSFDDFAADFMMTEACLYNRRSGHETTRGIKRTGKTNSVETY